MITVVITTYDDAEYLSAAIDSVLQQATTVNEIIVVDDGSDSLEAANVTDQFRESVVPVKYYRKENGGTSSARNFGLHLASTEFVAFLDADDQWLPENTQSKLKMLLQTNESVFGVYGSFIFSDSEDAYPVLESESTPPRDSIGRLGGLPGGVPFYLFRRQALVDVGGFDESLRLNEDFDLILRLIKHGLHCRGNSEPGFIRTVRPGSLSRGKDFDLDYKSIGKFLDKAEKNGYFTDLELTRRRKENEIRLARRMRLAGEPVWKYIRPLYRAFEHARPETWLEWLAYCLTRPLKFTSVADQSRRK